MTIAETIIEEELGGYKDVIGREEEKIDQLKTLELSPLTQEDKDFLTQGRKDDIDYYRSRIDQLENMKNDTDFVEDTNNLIEAGDIEESHVYLILDAYRRIKEYEATGVSVENKNRNMDQKILKMLDDVQPYSQQKIVVSFPPSPPKTLKKLYETLSALGYGRIKIDIIIAMLDQTRTKKPRGAKDSIKRAALITCDTKNRKDISSWKTVETFIFTQKNL